MLDKQPLTLNHPSVKAVKAKWDASQWRRSHKLTFEDLFEYFKADCVRYTKVAEVAGLTPQRVHQIYDKYFRDLFDDKSGRERTKACTLERWTVLAKQAENELFNQDPFVRKIVKKARLAGCTVEAIPDRKGVRVLSGRMVINGYLCSLHHFTSAVRPSKLKRSYVRSSVRYGTLTDTEILVINSETGIFPEKTFVVPTHVVRNAFEIPTKAGYISMNLPTEKMPVYRSIVPRIDYWQYEDAWHLLSPKQDPPAP